MLTIYADVLICVNLIIDYLLISLTSRFLKVACSFRRQLVGAFIGGICSLFILLPSKGFLIPLVTRAFTSTIVVLATYGIGDRGQFIRRICCFFAVSFAFFGGMFALWYFVKPPGLFVHNGMVYYNLSSVALVLSAAFTYGLISAIGRFVNRKNETTCRLRVVTEQGSADLTALVDSGNRLCEPFSEKPVVILDPKYKELLSYESNHKRVIPYNTLSGEGVLTGILPKGVYLIMGNSSEKLDVYIAISPEPLNKYQAIIGSNAI